MRQLFVDVDNFFSHAREFKDILGRQKTHKKLKTSRSTRDFFFVLGTRSFFGAGVAFVHFLHVLEPPLFFVFENQITQIVFVHISPFVFIFSRVRCRELLAG